MPPDWTTQAELVITLPAQKTFNIVMFQEQIRDYGQRIARFAVDAQVEGKWQQIAEGQTVGYKRICRTPDVTADKVRIRILDSRVCPTISNVALFHAPPIPLACHAERSAAQSKHLAPEHNVCCDLSQTWINIDGYGL
jgi:alpha-L-fucosidase